MGKKGTQKQLMHVSQEISQILNRATQRGHGTASEIVRVEKLVTETNRLRNIIKPPVNSPSVYRHDEELTRIEKLYSEQHGEFAKKCPSCGELDHNNFMNGRRWCMSCNQPFDSPNKKAIKKKTYKKIQITDEEVVAFNKIRESLSKT